MSLTGHLMKTWARIVSWHVAAGVTQFQLGQGASKRAIDDAEEQLGVPLPVDVRASWELHDGGLTDSVCILNHGHLLPLTQIVEQWKQYCAWQKDDKWGVGASWRSSHIRGPIRPVHWTPRRIAVTDNSGDSLMVDLDPPRGGTLGQIIEFSHEVGPQNVAAPSWSAFLEGWADDLERGKYVYFPDEDVVALPGEY